MCRWGPATPTSVSKVQPCEAKAKLACQSAVGFHQDPDTTSYTTVLLAVGTGAEPMPLSVYGDRGHCIRDSVVL